MFLPADSHVHSEWSWDTGGPSSDAAGRMRRPCEQAVRIGISTIAFTEHLDLDDRWQADDGDFVVQGRSLLNDAGLVEVPVLDVAGYMDSIDRCRHAFPELRIRTGVELGQPHLWERQARELLDLDALDQVNGSLHTLPIGDCRAEPKTLFKRWRPEEVIRAYLEEVPRMVSSECPFAVFTHIDYAARYWPAADAGPFDPHPFEDGFRAAMRAIAESGRALELNTRLSSPWVPQWWSEEGGREITFGSDAHTPDAIASRFPEAAAMAEQYGFRPGRQAEEPWTR